MPAGRCGTHIPNLGEVPRGQMKTKRRIEKTYIKDVGLLIMNM
jgi:hypothetical protein